MAESSKLQQRLKYGAASTIRSLRAKKRSRQPLSTKRRRRGESKTSAENRSARPNFAVASSRPVFAASAASAAGSAKNYVQRIKKVDTPPRPTVSQFHYTCNSRFFPHRHNICNNTNFHMLLYSFIPDQSSICRKPRCQPNRQHYRRNLSRTALK